MSLTKSYSLPKAQPTKSFSKIASSQNLYKYSQNSISKLNTTKIYIHELNIDYGHLEQPEILKQTLPENKLKQLKKNDNENENEENIDECLQKIQTKRYEFKNKTQKKKNKNDEQNQEIIYAKKTLRDNPQQKKQRKISLKLKQIYALETKLKQVIANQEISLQKTHREKTVDKKSISNTHQKMNISKMLESKMQNAFTNSPQIDSPIHKIHSFQGFQSLQQLSFVQEDSKLALPNVAINLNIPNTQSCQLSGNSSFRNSHKKVVHSRLIKTYVGGNKMQLKIINYPDDSEYLKLSQKKGKRKKNIGQTGNFRF